MGFKTAASWSGSIVLTFQPHTQAMQGHLWTPLSTYTPAMLGRETGFFNLVLWSKTIMNKQRLKGGYSVLLLKNAASFLCSSLNCPLFCNCIWHNEQMSTVKLSGRFLTKCLLMKTVITAQHQNFFWQKSGENCVQSQLECMLVMYFWRSLASTVWVERPIILSQRLGRLQRLQRPQYLKSCRN